MEPLYLPDTQIKQIQFYIVDFSNKLINDNLIFTTAYSVNLKFHWFCWQDKIVHFKGRYDWTVSSSQ